MLAAPRGPWVAGARLTVADFALAEIADQHEELEPGCVGPASPFAPLAAHREAVFALPPIAAYRASDAFRPHPVHNKYSHLCCP